jgi:hypothetical protein
MCTGICDDFTDVPYDGWDDLVDDHYERGGLCTTPCRCGLAPNLLLVERN